MAIYAAIADHHAEADFLYFRQQVRHAYMYYVSYRVSRQQSPLLHATVSSHGATISGLL